MHMKTTMVLFLTAVAWGVWVVEADAQSQPSRALFFPSNQWPPGPGLYVAPPGSWIGTPAGGLIVSNLLLGKFSESVPAPPPGTSVTLTLDAQADFDLSVNGGGTFSHVAVPVELTVSLTAIGIPGAGNGYSTVLGEFKPLGPLPGNLMLRQSGSQASTGQVNLTPAPGGSAGFLISSFFNVSLDFSADGGQTWQAMSPAQHLDLRVDPANPSEGTLVSESTPLFPAPDDGFLVPAVQRASFGGGIVIQGLRQTLFSAVTDGTALALGTTPTILPYTATLNFALSVDGGKTFTQTRTTANMSLSFAKISESASRLFDAEITQMDFSATVAGTALMFRESPSLSSYGGAELRSFGDGSFQFSSFFDVFLELSTDGGQTWAPANNGPLHLQLQPNSPRGQFASSNLPTPGGQYVLPALAYQTGPRAGVLIAGNTIGGFSASSPPPAAGQPLVQSFTAQVNLSISLDGGASYTDAAGTAAVTMLVTPSGINWGDTSYYNAVLQQLNVTGLPQGIMLRQSPTLTSTGRLSITPQPNSGGFKVDSFFDVFTELSLDGGQTWTAASSAAAAALTPSPIGAPLRITCPGDMSVLATSAQGAVVTYPPLLIQYGDCPFTPSTVGIAYSPPSGSLLPIGLTTVTVTADNECGEHSTCSFNVQVRPNLALARETLSIRPLLPPPGAMFLEPAQFSPVTVGGIIVSNFTLRNFANGIVPPPAGSSETLETPATAELDWSPDYGATFPHASVPAKLVLNIQDNGSGQLPGQEVYSLSVVRLDIAGSNLPPAVMLRASLTQPSSGQAAIRTAPGTGIGGNLLIGLLDVFFDVSTDGGQTWTPGDGSVHLELRADPAVQTPVPEFTPLWPPPADQLASPPGASALFPGGIVVKDVQQGFFLGLIDLTLLDPSSLPIVQRFNSVVQLKWSQDGGQTFNVARVPALIGLLMQGIRQGATQMFDAQVTQMDIAGGDLSQNVRLRVSPTLSSDGQVALQGLADGSFQITSFFDVFLEVSGDGGQTWQPASNGSLHFDLKGASQVLSVASPNQPPSGGQYVIPTGAKQTFMLPTGAILVISNETWFGFTGSIQPPASGQTNRIDFRSQVSLQLSLDGGNTFSSYNAPAAAVVQLIGDGNIDWGDRQFLDTQIIQWTVAGGTLPQGLVLRQSLTQPSLGRTGISTDATGSSRVESFYNFSQELSQNGGQSWNPAVEGPTWLVLNWPPGFAPYGVTCPADITVYATSPGGAVVNYSLPPMTVFPDCPLCCFQTTCTPPSGSLFPIGTTTVLCQGHDGCNENPSCSFNVTVLPGSIVDGVVAAPLGNADLNLSHGTNGPISMVVSNIGPSGQDGFHVNLGAADSLVLNFDPFPNYDITGMVSTVTGPYAGDPNHLLGTSTYQGGPNAMVMVDFSAIGATSVVARVTDENHNTISSEQIPNGSWFNVNDLFPPGCTNPTSTVCTITMGPGLTCWRFCRYGCTCQGTNCTIERVVCLFELAPRPLAISAIDFTAQSSSPPSALIIQDTEVGMFGNRHVVIGDGTLQTDGGLLVVNGIGSSGNDGVDLNLNHVGGISLAFTPLRLLAPNVCLTFNAVGDVNGVLGVQAGSLSLGGSGGTLTLDGDFSGLGASQVRVEVYLNSQFQGAGTFAVGGAGSLTLTGNLIGAGTLAGGTGFFARFDSPAGAGGSGFIFTGGNLNLTGDEIHILAADPTNRLGGLNQVGIRSCNTGQIGIVGEQVTPLMGGLNVVGAGTLVLTGQGAAGQNYRLESAGTLGMLTAWRTLATTQSDDEGYLQLSDTLSNGQTFYRVAVPPPPGIDNLSFLGQLYQNLLGRSLDAGSQSYWLNYLATGGSRSNVVANLTTTDEYLQNLVKNLYQQLLHRAAQPNDLSYGVNFLQNGGTDEKLIAFLTGSPEYFTNRGNGSNAGFLEALYIDLLARPLDAVGQQFFLQQLNSGTTTAQVATEVLGSAEYRQDLVATFYWRFLQRAPTVAEVNAYSLFLGAGGTDEQLIDIIAGSAAF
ncbi:MAG TPA: DUF4214 domain-containing protein [Verrucomicrobiae bacterium]|nr:DUF4214 domain-containing protein [Verrucomicrobiae bacterium]